MQGPVYYLDGGLEIDGREILPLDLNQIEETVNDIGKHGITKVALVGVFSPLDHSGIHEERCKELMLKRNSGLDIVCSHSIGGVGLLERENATILNASILAVARRTVNGFKRAMKKLQLSCPLYLTQNDGTLTGADEAAKLPIKTFASGPTNSMTGAAFLAGLDKPRVPGDTDAGSQILVVDIGGTTTDICALLPSGFPRQAPNFVEVGSVRTAFSMPDVLSVGLGGGSLVTVSDDGKVSVGPGSVGHYLTSKALVFGGDVRTSTDIVVAAGKEKIGNPELALIPDDVVEGARKCIKSILQRAVDDMKVSSAPVTVLLVGGGSIVYMDELEGVAKCIIPPHHDSANAVGAAIAKVAGEVDLIEILDGRDETAVLKAASEKAVAAATEKGADPEDVKVVEIEKMPLQYVTNKATRIKIKTIGKLRTPDPSTKITVPEKIFSSEEDEDAEPTEEAKKSTPGDNHKTMTKPSLDIDIPSYRPDVRDEVWYVSEVDLEFIACGTGILGTGGGGPSYLAYLIALDALRTGGKDKMRVVSPQYLQDSDLVCFGSWYGAPSVSGERISSGTEIPAAIDALNRILGIDNFQALLADEIGGGNGYPLSLPSNQWSVLI
jgi:N-methylhydantoinase A/oxoprolinase/acetone carboxylase beta subunit